MSSWSLPLDICKCLHWDICEGELTLCPIVWALGLSSPRPLRSERWQFWLPARRSRDSWPHVPISNLWQWVELSNLGFSESDTYFYLNLTHLHDIDFLLAGNSTNSHVLISLIVSISDHMTCAWAGPTWWSRTPLCLNRSVGGRHLHQSARSYKLQHFSELLGLQHLNVPHLRGRTGREKGGRPIGESRNQTRCWID